MPRSTPIAGIVGSAPAAARRAAARVAERTGVTPFNLRLLTSLHRPEWLYRPGNLPKGTLSFPPPAQADDEDVALAERLIAAYHLAVGERPPEGATTGMWAWIFEQRQRELADALLARDARTLAGLLATMLRQDFVVGMVSGSLVQAGSPYLTTRAWWLRSLDALVSLAEQLGVVATENPEQGVYGRAFARGIDDLVGRIEAQLGFPISLPPVGSPYGVPVGGDRVVTTETPEQIEAAVRLDEIIDRYLPTVGTRLRIVEIGAGYGGLAWWFLLLRPDLARYTIVDVPIVNVLHGYFLSKALGTSRVSLLGEPPAQVCVVPNTGLAEVGTPFDVLVNKDSFPEMPEEAMVEYLTWAKDACQGLLYSYNQEALAEFRGEAQNLVPAGIERVGGYRRVERQPSWVRRGYVQEVYLLRAAGLSPADDA